jgi:hypothetical protein
MGANQPGRQGGRDRCAPARRGHRYPAPRRRDPAIGRIAPRRGRPAAPDTSRCLCNWPPRTLAGGQVDGDSSRLRRRCGAESRSAAELWELLPLAEGAIHVTVPAPCGGRTRRRALRIHRSSLPLGDTAIRGGIPVTTPARTIADLKGSVLLRKAIREAEFRGFDLGDGRHRPHSLRAGACLPAALSPLPLARTRGQRSRRRLHGRLPVASGAACGRNRRLPSAPLPRGVRGRPRA